MPVLTSRGSVACGRSHFANVTCSWEARQRTSLDLRRMNVNEAKEKYFGIFFPLALRKNIFYITKGKKMYIGPVI